MAQYREGRVTVTADSDVATGTDTNWIANVAPGDIFLIRGEEVPYRIAAVLTDSSLRLSARYAGPTETNTFYSITRDFTEYLDLPIIHNGDVDAVPLFAEALIQLDAKIKLGGAGGGATNLGSLSDVTVAGAAPGDQLTMLPSGSFGFVHPTPFTIAFDHAPGDGARIFKSYAGGTVTARRIKAAGGTVNENADDITITIPPPGEVNTLATAGSSESQSLAASKSGAVLRTKGLRAGTNVTITPEGNDLVIASAGGGGAPISYTLTAAGTGASLVAPPSGTEFRIRALAFDGNFTTTQDSSGALAIALKTLPITQISTVQWDAVGVGQFLTRNAGGQIVGATPSAPGIAALFDDKTPKLGGPLDASGQRIIGAPMAFSGMFERPKAKSYVLCLSAPAAMKLESITTGAAAGSLSFRVDVGSLPVSSPDAPTSSGIEGTAGTSRQTLTATPSIAVDPSQPIFLTLSAISADIEDFSYTLSGTST